MNTKNIIQNGQRISVPMTAMDAASPVEATLQARLVDAQAAYRLNMREGLNDLVEAQQALDAHRAAQAPTVTDTGPSEDYLAGLRDAAIYKAQDAWRG